MQRGVERVDKEVDRVIVSHVDTMNMVEIGRFKKIPAIEAITQEKE